VESLHLTRVGSSFLAKLVSDPLISRNELPREAQSPSHVLFNAERNVGVSCAAAGYTTTLLRHVN